MNKDGIARARVRKDCSAVAVTLVQKLSGAGKRLRAVKLGAAGPPLGN